MQLQLKAVGLDLSESMKVYVDEKITQRLERFIEVNHRESVVAEVHLEYASGDTTGTRDKCKVTMTGLGNGQVARAEEEAEDMHVAIDRTSQKLEEQLRRHHDKLRDHIHRKDGDAKYVAPEELMETEPLEEVDETDELPPVLRPDGKDS